MYLQSSINGGPSVNRLLATLPKNEYKRLLPELKTVKLALGEVLYKSGDAIKYVYFPNDSIISLISELSESSSLEVGMVGNEGMVGLGAFMGVNFSSTRALVQGAGTAMRMNSAVVRQEAIAGDNLNLKSGHLKEKENVVDNIGSFTGFVVTGPRR